MVRTRLNNQFANFGSTKVYHSQLGNTLPPFVTVGQNSKGLLNYMKNSIWHVNRINRSVNRLAMWVQPFGVYLFNLMISKPEPCNRRPGVPFRSILYCRIFQTDRLTLATSSNKCSPKPVELASALHRTVNAIKFFKKDL